MTTNNIIRNYCWNMIKQHKIAVTYLHEHDIVHRDLKLESKLKYIQEKLLPTLGN
jgi:serine/threonine protein kinase